MCWQYTGVGPAGDPVEVGDRMRLVCDGYGSTDRGGVLDAVLWWQDRCWRGIDAEAADGDPAKARLRDAGVSAAIRQTYHWVQDNQASITARL